MKILRSKEAAASVNVKTWPNIIDTGTEMKYIPIAFMTTVEGSVSLTWLFCVYADDLPKKRPSHIYKPPTAEMLAYLDFSVSTTGMLTGVKASLIYPFTCSFCFREELVCRVFDGLCAKQLVYLFLLDISLSGQCSVSVHQTAVWAVLVQTNCHLHGPLLWPGLCAVVYV